MVRQEIEVKDPLKALDGPAQFGLGLLPAFGGQLQPESEVRMSVLFVGLKLQLLHSLSFIGLVGPDEVVEGGRLMHLRVVKLGLASEASLVRKDEIVATVLVLNGLYACHNDKGQLDVVAKGIGVGLVV